MIAKAHSHGWDKDGGPIIPADQPAWTVTAKDGSALVAPMMVPMQHQNEPTGLDTPLQTITTQGNKFNLVPGVMPNSRRISAGITSWPFSDTVTIMIDSRINLARLNVCIVSHWLTSVSNVNLHYN